MVFKVSLIIPCYNILTNKKFFDETLNSIINQSIKFENVELLLIDDSSPDNSLNYLKNISEKYSNVKVFSTENNTGSPSIPRNIGINNASAEYVIFLDQDDILTEKSIEIRYENIKKYDLDIVKTNHITLSNNQLKYNDSGKNEKFFAKPKSNELKYYNVFIWNAIFKKQFLIENKINFKKKFGEDILFTAECLSKTKKDILILNNFYSVKYNLSNSNSLTHYMNFKKSMELIETTHQSTNILVKNQFENDFLTTYITWGRYSLIAILFSIDNKAKYKNKILNAIKKYIDDFDDFEYNPPSKWSFLHKIMWKTLTFLIKNNNRKIIWTIISIHTSIFGRKNI